MAHLTQHTTPIKLDLNKAARTFRLLLDKEGVAPDIVAQILELVDCSSSFEHEHEEGTTSKFTKRIVPWAKVLDPDKQVDVITFAHGDENATFQGFVNEANCEDWIINHVINKVPGWNGGTTYSYAVERAQQRMGWVQMDPNNPAALAQGPGFLSRAWNFLAGNPPVLATTPKPALRQRAIVLLLSDGENDPSGQFGDKDRTRRLLREAQERGDDMYFLMIGACEHGVDFAHMKALAMEFKNTGVVTIRDLDAFVDMTDEEVNEALLVPELRDWLKQPAAIAQS